MDCVGRGGLVDVVLITTNWWRRQVKHHRMMASAPRKIAARLVRIDLYVRPLSRRRREMRSRPPSDRKHAGTKCLTQPAEASLLHGPRRSGILYGTSYAESSAIAKSLKSCTWTELHEGEKCLSIRSGIAWSEQLTRPRSSRCAAISWRVTALVRLSRSVAQVTGEGTLSLKCRIKQVQSRFLPIHFGKTGGRNCVRIVSEYKN